MGRDLNLRAQRYREIIELDLDGLSIEEIAEQLEISEKEVLDALGPDDISY